ncbi:peptide-methionine (S)-S-oxide reductase MsrA [Sphingomonas sp. ID1715]|uniref:peptide-methionine (S)-S-oxide reductase MsrA n=1 Tax=Sphingomonas sp. ID1715 TaxID=1656898 RepID=UPI0014894B81|nr:peptide-methionine (S)-S-oxide reductase MsrA [Sphingomonas sp. ID1715]NNM76893.1 peptide-methionine (S)-S-oxide reductase MsrA [Sphingomonas sp. ID1715]
MRARASFGIIAGLTLAAWAVGGASIAESARAIPVPAPKIDAARPAALQTAVLAGGCFWGMEAVFEHLKGVKSVTSGYAGGDQGSANYDAVSTERTRHAEAVRIVFDPRQISYGTLLRVYFGVAHDPTQLNRQGPDTGPSYRSAIFPIGAEQERVARAYLAQLAAAKVYPRPIVTRIERGPFFPAEAYHQNFARRNPQHGYIRTWDEPKMAALKAAFPALWQDGWSG